MVRLWSYYLYNRVYTFPPFSTSFWGIVEIITTVIAIYGMLMVKKKTGNAWGCVFAFCFIWNAI